MFDKEETNMFPALSSFSIFFFSVASLLLIGILFEEKFLALEDKFDAYIDRKKKQKKQSQIHKYQAEKSQHKSTCKKSSCRKEGSCKSRGYAA